MDRYYKRLKRTSGMLGCEVHNYILIKQGITTNTYKCSKCRDILKLERSNACCECIRNCKGQVQNRMDKENKVYIKCSGYRKG